MIAKCEKYPCLCVCDIGVRFKKGIAEVSEKQAEALRKMKGFDFTFEEAPAEEEPKKAAANKK